MTSSRPPKIYPVGHECNSYTVVSELQKRMGIKPTQLCKCKCGREKWIATYRLNPNNNGSVTSCRRCANLFLPHINKNYLIIEYVEKRRTMTDLAKENDCDIGVISRRIDSFGLPKHLFEIHHLAGRKFGKWTALEKVVSEYESSTNKIDYICECECGNKSKVHCGNLLGGWSHQCQQCSGKENRGSKSVHWKGYKEINGNHWNRIKREATNRGFSFDIHIEYAFDLYEEQDRKCKLTGWDIAFKEYHGGETTASLDRIDSHQGYIIGNVQWLHKDINLIKLDFEQNRFFEICEAVVNHRHKI